MTEHSRTQTGTEPEAGTKPETGTETGAAAEVAELRRYEEERRAVRRRRDQVSWVIVGWMMAAALALLAYDSATAALGAHRDGRPWTYPAVLALACGVALIILAAWGVRRSRGR